MSTIQPRIVNTPSKPSASHSQAIVHCYALPTPNQVSILAHDQFIAHGRKDGHDLEHWLDAE